jgi:hypothetical protein
VKRERRDNKNNPNWKEATQRKGRKSIKPGINVCNVSSNTGI